MRPAFGPVGASGTFADRFQPEIVDQATGEVVFVPAGQFPFEPVREASAGTDPCGRGRATRGGWISGGIGKRERLHGASVVEETSGAYELLSAGCIRNGQREVPSTVSDTPG
jgi:hypothetical protein